MSEVEELKERLAEVEQNYADCGQTLRLLFAVLPGAMTAVMVAEHNRWLDGATEPLPPDKLWEYIQDEVGRLSEEDGKLRLPSLGYAEEVEKMKARAVESDDLLRGVLDFYGGLLPMDWQVKIKAVLDEHGAWSLRDA